MDNCVTCGQALKQPESTESKSVSFAWRCDFGCKVKRILDGRVPYNGYCTAHSAPYKRVDSEVFYG